MRKIVITIGCLFATLGTSAQESQEAYSFLKLPVSVHAAALGGDNITISDDDAALVFHNPALISNTTDRTLDFNYMTYIEGSKTASAAFVKAWGDRATWAVSGQLMDYGTMRHMDVGGADLGDFSAKDMALAASLAYLLGDRWSGGITLRFISSDIAAYTSTAIATDIGLNYDDSSHGLSFSAVVKNLGGQISKYDEMREKLPVDLQAGVTKRLKGAPLRFSATLSRLNHWDEKFIRHLTIGADLLIGQHMYVAAGYNFRRKDEMLLDDGESSSSHGAGLSCGAGLELRRIKLQVAYAKYHVSASSLLLGVQYSF